MSIRPCKVEDIQVLSEINETSLGYTFSYQDTLVQFKSIVNNNDHMIYVYEDNTQVLGYIHLHKYVTLYTPPCINVLALCVHTNHQHKGIGKKLLLSAEIYAKNNGLNSIRLNSGEHRHEAHIFYEKNGYISKRSQKYFYKILK